MNCPKCETWNPEDKKVCWRCQTPLPTPTQPKKRGGQRTVLGIPVWILVVAALFLLAPVLNTCLSSLLRQ